MQVPLISSLLSDNLQEVHFPLASQFSHRVSQSPQSPVPWSTNPLAQVQPSVEYFLFLLQVKQRPLGPMQVWQAEGQLTHPEEERY